MAQPLPRLPFLLLVPLAAGAAVAADAVGSFEEFARAMAVKPGGWHTSLKIVTAEVEVQPGADPALAAQIRARTQAQVGQIKEIDECLDSASGPPGMLIEPECSFSRIEAGDGRWALDATCPKPERHGSGRIVAQGTYSAESVTGRHQADLSSGGVVVHARIETTSRFTGDCRPPLVPAPAPEGD